MPERLFLTKESYKHFEKIAEEAKIKDRDRDIEYFANGVLSLAKELRYLNGCVKRGRGEDIDPEHPGRNVFEYIKELESKLKAD